MEALDNLRRVETEVFRCMKCGFCMYFCPVYRETYREAHVARGRNVLAMELLEGKPLDWGHLEERYSLCLTCNRCAQFCPAKVNVATITLAARGDIVQHRGLPWWKRLAYRGLITRRKLFGRTLKVASKLQALLPRTEGKIRHLPTFLSALGKGRQIPEIAGRFLREELPEVNSPPEGVKRRMRVAYFAGCATDYVFPEVGKKVVEFLTRRGVEVVFPKGQGCCGMPVMGSGDFVTARELADRNVEVLEGLDVDYIVTACATCGSAIKEGYLNFLADTEERKARYEALAKKVRDFNEFVVDVLKAEEFATDLEPGTKVTYHDPCHLARYQGITAQPRQIIKSLPGVEFVEMAEPDRCCGMGGAFNIEHYDLSKRIAQKKVDAIAQTGADVVVTACPGCMIQLIDQTRQRGLSPRVMHIAELLK